MKRILYTLSLLTAITFVSCEKDLDNQASLNSEDKITATWSVASPIVLEQAKATETALTVSWETALHLNVGYLVHQVEFSYNGEISRVVATESPFKMTVQELNKAITKLGVTAGTPTEIKVAVKGDLNDFSGDAGNEFRTSITSAEHTIIVTSYVDLIDPTEWGIVGHATPNGWDGPDLPFWKNPTNDKERVAYVTLKDGEIKFRKNNEWKEDFGDNGKDGTLDAGGANIPVTAGTYKITWNTDANTYTIEKYSWSIIGDGANGWNAGDDIPLVYDGPTNTWKAKNVTLKDGGIKFRFNNDWAVGWGDKEMDGKLDQENDNNIKVSAGTYTITVDFSVTPHTYTIK